MGFLANLLVKIGVDNSDLNAGMDKATRSVNKFGDDVESAGRRLTLGFTLPMAGLGLAAIKTAGEMEQAKVGFTTLLKSSDEAGKHLDQLKNFALVTPFQFQDLTRASRLMQAYGFAASDVIPKLKTIGNAVSALGGGSDLLERVVRSIGEIGTRGKITGEQLRELSRAGIPALDAVAKKLGVSTAEAQKQITAGGVDAKTAMEGLLEYMDTRFRGGMEAQSKTLLGSWSNIKDKITFTLAGIGDALLPIAKNVIGALDPALDKVKNLAESFSKLPKPIQDVILVLAGTAAVAPLLTLAFGATITNAIAIGGAVAKAIPLIGKLAAGFELWVAGMGAASTSWGVMVGSGMFAIGVWTALAVAVLKLASANWELAEAKEAAAEAGKTQENSLAKLEATLRERAKGNADVLARLDELKHSYVGGSMGDRDGAGLTNYLRYLRDIGKQLSANISDETQHATKLVDIDKLLSDSGLKTMAQRRKDLDQAKTLYAEVVKEYGAGSVIAAEALRKVNDAQAALIPTLEAVKNKTAGMFPFGSKGLESAVIVERIREADASLQKYVVDVVKAGGIEEHRAKQIRSVADALELMTHAGDNLPASGEGTSIIDGMLSAAAKLPPELKKISDAIQNTDDVMHSFGLTSTHELRAEYVAALEAAEALRKHGASIADLGPVMQHVAEVHAALSKRMGGTWGGIEKGMSEARKETARMFSGIERGIASSLTHFKTFGSTMKSLFQTIGEDILNLVLHRILKGVEESFANIVESLFTKTATQAATTQATTAALNVGTVTSDAAVASAATFASISAIPVVGPFMAAGMAAAAYAQVMAMAPLAMFKLGGDVPRDMPAYLHANEMVLPADIAGPLRKSLRQQGDGAGGGSVAVHFNGPVTFGFGVTQSSVTAFMNQAVRQLRLAGARI